MSVSVAGSSLLTPLFQNASSCFLYNTARGSKIGWFIFVFIFPTYFTIYILRVMVPWLRTDLVVQLLVFLVVLVTHSLSSESKSMTTAALLGKIKWRSFIKWTNLWIKTKRRISQKQDANPEISMTSVNIPFWFLLFLIEFLKCWCVWNFDFSP